MSKKTNWALYGATLSVNLVSLNAWGAYSWTSPVLPKLNGDKESNDNPFGRTITPFEESWTASLLSLGASFGPFLALAVMDKIGRKKTLLLASIPMIISHVILSFAANINLWYFSRFLLGLGAGVVCSIIPIYTGEIAEDSNRGRLGCFMTLLGVTGMLFCFAVGPYISIKLFCWMFVIPPVAFLITFGIFVPESPYYWYMVNNEKEAKLSFKKLRREYNEKELEEIKSNVQRSQEIKTKFVNLIRSKPIMKGLLITCGLMFFQQLSGISAIISYTQSIFNASGTNLAPEISALIIGVIQFTINLMTAQVVDKLGRRILLFASFTGLFFSHVSLGLFFYLKTNNFDNVVSYISWLPVGSLILYIIAYGVGIGPVPWTMTGELFPPHFRAIASTCSSFVCLFLAFILTFIFPNVTQMIGMAATFWLFSVFCAAGVIFVWRIVPETKGKSLRNIQDALEGNNKSY